MKKIFYTIALVVMGFTASYAQKSVREKLTPEQRAEKEATLMQQKLSLSEDQKSKIQTIQLERIKKSEEWRNADQGDRKGKIEERKAFAKANREKVEAILTPDQKKTWEASRAEMRDKMQDRMKARKDGKRHGEKTTPTPPAPAQNN